MYFNHMQSALLKAIRRHLCADIAASCSRITCSRSCMLTRRKKVEDLGSFIYHGLFGTVPHMISLLESFVPKRLGSGPFQIQGDEVQWHRFAKT